MAICCEFLMSHHRSALTSCFHIVPSGLLFFNSHRNRGTHHSLGYPLAPSFHPFILGPVVFFFFSSDTGEFSHQGKQCT